MQEQNGILMKTQEHYIPVGIIRMVNGIDHTDAGLKQTGWQKIGGIWYYMNADGVMTTGWQGWRNMVLHG